MASLSDLPACLPAYRTGRQAGRQAGPLRARRPYSFQEDLQ